MDLLSERIVDDVLDHDGAFLRRAEAIAERAGLSAAAALLYAGARAVADDTDEATYRQTLGERLAEQRMCLDAWKPAREELVRLGMWPWSPGFDPRAWALAWRTRADVRWLSLPERVRLAIVRCLTTPEWADVALLLCWEGYKRGAGTDALAIATVVGAYQHTGHTESEARELIETQDADLQRLVDGFDGLKSEIQAAGLWPFET